MRALLLAGVTAFGWLGAARAAVIVDLTQTTAGVTMTGSGSLDLAGLGSPGQGSFSASIDEAQSSLVLGPASGSLSGQIFFIGAQTETFGTSGSFVAPTSGSGTPFGIIGQQGGLILPTGYTSGSSLSATDTFSGATFASLDLIVGTYTFALPNDTFTVDVVSPSPTAVPEPASMALLGTGLLGMLAVRRRRQG